MKIAIPALEGMKYDNYRAALSALDAEGVIVSADCDADDYAGLLLPGGVDVDPALYGQENRACMGVNRALDDCQLAVLKRFVERGKPVFGICRGHQLINVFFGGTLIQHLPQSARHRRDEGVDVDKAHDTRIDNDSFLYYPYGARARVNSSHHQAVDRLGRGLRAIQWSDDGVIEGAQHESLPVYSVQWHPERMGFGEWPWPDGAGGAPVFAYFLRRCRDLTKDKEA